MDQVAGELTGSWSGLHALHGTQPLSVAACLLMTWRSSAVKNRISRQSLRWYLVMPGTTLT